MLLLKADQATGPGKKFPKHFLTCGIAGALSLAIIFGAFQESESIGTAAVRVLAEATSGLLPHDERGHTNILLLGVGDKSHAAAGLTDSMIVASIDPDSKSVVLLSIPRDVYVEDAKDIGAGRINAMYVSYRALHKKEKGMTESGASLLAMQDVADDIGMRLGMNIHGVMKMDFIGFTNIVDAVGGVDVDVPERLVDYSYPVQEGVIGTFEIDAGPQHLDGETALQYARSRHSTSDFSRSARQQLILAAIGDKVRNTKFISNMDAVHAVQVAIRDHFETTLGPTELFALGTTLASVPRDHIVSMNLNYASGGDYSDAEAGGFIRVPPEGTFTGAVLLPVSPTDEVADWSMIRFFSQLIFGRRDVYVRKPRVVIVQGDAAVREAHRLRNELVRYGFDAVHERGEASGTGTMITSVQTDDGAFFSSLLGMPLVQETSGTGTAIRIRLGENYEFTPLVKAAE